ncbi:MAG: hypothetical protein ACE5JK_01375 [Candidatus Omnitrophota bacterium]
MKKIIAIAVVITLIMGNMSAFAERERRARRARRDERVKGKAEHRQQHSLRYMRMMRDLDREYQEGSLTRTEYIQRKREIKTLEE